MAANMADLEMIIASAEAEWTCEHEALALVVHVKKNGARNFYMQCERCGELVRHLRGSDLSEADKASAVSRDEWKRQQYWDERSKSLQTLYNMRWAMVRNAGRQEYEEYIKSPEWRALRVKVFRRCKGICEGCGENAAVQVHHLTYDRLGNEMLFDLVAVCLHCHERLHPDRPR